MLQGSLRLALGLLVLVTAAVLEVAGDAIVRRGMVGRSLALGALGFAMLGSYGVVVNLLKQDFSRTLGTYVGVFAVASILAGKLAFGDRIAPASWVGLGIILVGCVVIQVGTLPR